MKLHHLASLLLLPALLLGCSSNNDHDLVIVRQGGISIDFEDGAVLLHAANQPDGRITSDGDFSIDRKSITLTPPQRDLFKQYYGDAGKIRDEGIATGKAGAAMAGHAIGDVVSGLAHGDPDKIGPTIEARASKITAKASQICDTLEQMRTVQDAISGQLAAFRPYATLNADKVAQCKKGLDEANHSLAGH